MKVLFNVESLTPPLTGIGTYTTHLIEGLRRHRKVNEVATFNRSELVPGKSMVPRAMRLWLKQNPLVEKLWERLKRRKMEGLGMDRQGYVYHEPNFVALAFDGPIVVTVMDLSHLRFPQYHKPEHVRLLNRHLEMSVKRASQVICPSFFVRDEVIESFGVLPEKVNAIYLGATGTFHPRTGAELQQVLLQYGLQDQRYILSVSTIEPRKNLAGLISAYSELPGAMRRQFPLVLVGPRGWKTDPLQRMMASLEDEGCLRWLGYVPIADLPALYAGAHAFAYLSFYEGFGLPLVEAMASGIPTIISDRAALPEIAGGAALEVDPEDCAAIVTGLTRLLGDEPYRKMAAAQGLESARRFRWEDCVDQTVRVYEKALQNCSG